MQQESTKPFAKEQPLKIEEVSQPLKSQSPNRKRKASSEDSTLEPPRKKVKSNEETSSIRGRFRLKKNVEKIKPRVLKTASPKRMKPVPKPQLAINSEIVSESQSTGRLGWHEVRLSCVVKKESSMFSSRVKSLSKGDKVHVIHRLGKRAKIDQPVSGWCSFESLNGSQILLPIESDAHSLPPEEGESEEHLIASKTGAGVRQAILDSQAKPDSSIQAPSSIETLKENKPSMKLESQNKQPPARPAKEVSRPMLKVPESSMIDPKAKYVCESREMQMRKQLLHRVSEARNSTELTLQSPKEKTETKRSLLKSLKSSITDSKARLDIKTNEAHSAKSSVEIVLKGKEPKVVKVDSQAKQVEKPSKEMLRALLKSGKSSSKSKSDSKSLVQTSKPSLEPVIQKKQPAAKPSAVFPLPPDVTRRRLSIKSLKERLLKSNAGKPKSISSSGSKVQEPHNPLSRKHSKTNPAPVPPIIKKNPLSRVSKRKSHSRTSIFGPPPVAGRTLFSPSISKVPSFPAFPKPKPKPPKANDDPPSVDEVNTLLDEAEKILHSIIPDSTPSPTKANAMSHIKYFDDDPSPRSNQSKRDRRRSPSSSSRRWRPSPWEDVLPPRKNRKTRSPSPYRSKRDKMRESTRRPRDRERGDREQDKSRRRRSRSPQRKRKYPRSTNLPPAKRKKFYTKSKSAGTEEAPPRRVKQKVFPPLPKPPTPKADTTSKKSQKPFSMQKDSVNRANSFVNPARQRNASKTITEPTIKSPTFKGPDKSAATPLFPPKPSTKAEPEVKTPLFNIPNSNKANTFLNPPRQIRPPTPQIAGGTNLAHLRPKTGTAFLGKYEDKKKKPGKQKWKPQPVKFPCELCAKTINKNDIPNHSNSKKHMKALKRLPPPNLYMHLCTNPMYSVMPLPHLQNSIFTCHPCKLALWIDVNGQNVKEAHFRSQGHKIAVGENNIPPEDGHKCPLCKIFIRKKWVVKHIQGPQHQNKLRLHNKMIQNTEQRLRELFEANMELQEFEKYQEYDEAEEFVMDLFNTDELPTADPAEESVAELCVENADTNPESMVSTESAVAFKKSETKATGTEERNLNIAAWVAEQRLQKKPILLPHVMNKFHVSREEALQALEKKLSK